MYLKSNVIPADPLAFIAGVRLLRKPLEDNWKSNILQSEVLYSQIYVINAAV